MGKQSSDSAQKGPGLKSVTKAGKVDMAPVPVKGASMPAPKKSKG